MMNMYHSDAIHLASKINDGLTLHSYAWNVVGSFYLTKMIGE